MHAYIHTCIHVVKTSEHNQMSYNVPTISTSAFSAGVGWDFNFNIFFIYKYFI